MNQSSVSVGQLEIDSMKLSNLDITLNLDNNDKDDKDVGNLIIIIQQPSIQQTYLMAFQAYRKQEMRT